MGAAERADQDTITCGTEKSKHKYGRKHSRRWSKHACPSLFWNGALICFSLGGLWAAWNCGIIFGFRELVTPRTLRVAYFCMRIGWVAVWRCSCCRLDSAKSIDHLAMCLAVQVWIDVTSIQVLVGLGILRSRASHWLACRWGVWRCKDTYIWRCLRSWSECCMAYLSACSWFQCFAYVAALSVSCACIGLPLG